MATSEDDDRKLTAYLDGELDEVERAALDAQLATDATLRARLDALRAAADHTRAAFAALLETAPLADMRTRLDAALAALPARAAPPWRQRAAAIAAAVAIVAFAAGLSAGRWSASPGDDVADRDDWRRAVVEYMALYTPESFGEAVSPQLGEELASLSRRLDAPLDVDRLKIDDFSPRRARYRWRHYACRDRSWHRSRSDRSWAWDMAYGLESAGLCLLHRWRGLWTAI